MASDTGNFRNPATYTLWMTLFGALLLGVIFALCWVTAAHGEFSARIVGWMAARSELNFSAFYNGLVWSVAIGAALGATAALTYLFVCSVTTKKA